MNKRLVILKKLIFLSGAKLIRYSRMFFKAIFSKKSILFVSQNKIRSYSIGPVSQVVIIAVVICTINLFVKSWKYGGVIEDKVVEIGELKEANQQFQKEVNSLSDNLEKINRYFKSVTSYNNAASKNDINQEIEKLAPAKFKNIFGGMKLSRSDKKIAMKIASSNAILDNIKDGARSRIEDLQKKISITGLTMVNNRLVLNGKANKNENGGSVEISLNNVGDLSRKQGGPFNKINSAYKRLYNQKNHSVVNIEDDIAYLSDLEKFIHYAPLSKPMNNYYISSSFGERSDPIKGVRATHNGMDFVGKISEKVLSPSIGKVIFAGRFGAYGTGIVIDHGYGITTRYGHLSKIKVAKGDYVKRGDIIGIQGSTGRSTGSHLHYEVRYKNIPLNPKKFLQSGQAIFNDDKSANNVDS